MLKSAYLGTAAFRQNTEWFKTKPIHGPNFKRITTIFYQTQVELHFLKHLAYIGMYISHFLQILLVSTIDLQVIENKDFVYNL